jgi:hypothetical protein
MRRNIIVRLWLFASLIALSTPSFGQPGERNPLPRKEISRPEERDEQFSTLTTSDAVVRLSRSKDAIERRKLAKVIGDRSIAGSLQLSEPEKEQLKQEVTNILHQAKSPDGNERAEARQQIERLWHAAAPTLIANVTTNDLTIAELAVKSLILMRDESIVNDLIREAKTTTDEGRRQMLIFAFSKMKEQSKPLIPGRECLDDNKSQELYSRLVVPALGALKPVVAH